MKFQKRGDGAQDSAPAPATPDSRKKPVFLYILILFTVAFALILVSFIMHQRSNQQVLGELQNSVNVIEQLQDALDENAQLQKELNDTQKELEKAQAALEKAQSDDETGADAAAGQAAMELLYTLQQEYSAGRYDRCQAVIAELEAGAKADLPTESVNEVVVSPAQRYGQLKAAVEAKLAEAEAQS